MVSSFVVTETFRGSETHWVEFFADESKNFKMLVHVDGHEVVIPEVVEGSGSSFGHGTRLSFKKLYQIRRGKYTL